MAGLRKGTGFIHHGVAWKIERVTPEWIYCRPPPTGRQKWRRFLETDGTMAWCHEAVLKALRKNKTKDS